MVWTGWHLAKLLLIFLQVTLVLLTGPLVFDFIQLKKHICLLNILFWLTRKRNACGLESGSWSVQFQWWQASSWFEYNVWQLLNLLLEIRICIVQHSMKITLFIVKHNSNGNFFFHPHEYKSPCYLFYTNVSSFMSIFWCVVMIKNVRQWMLGVVGGLIVCLT